MKKHISLFIIIFFITLSSFAQSSKPKVALVLSGGGAKGIAHIPTLQALDSLGIVPDLIIGTSMGSIVGALYASGYSGDSIASISNSTDWGKLFSSEIPVTAVSNEEKSEYKRYLTEIEWKDGKPKQKTSIISDQNINAFFNKVTYPVNDIKNFDNLPIPFKAMSVDIVNGKEVILDKGSLSFAMRSSMSIPAVFKPMPYKDVLLVDGGVLNNFPVDIAKKYGADIIIGSDVGGGMEPKEKLDSPVTVVFQAAMLASNLKVPENKKMCDVLIDHTEHLTHSTGSFNKNVEIYDEGKIALKENLEQLVQLSKKLSRFPQKKVSLPEAPQSIFLDTIVYEGISRENMDLFNSRTQLKAKNTYTLDVIHKASENALGTNLFDGITFRLFHVGEKQGLKIVADEKSKHLFKGSLHFDDFRGIGLALNYTGRNILGNSSRVLLSVDLTKDFRYRGQYQKNFGAKKDWWFRSDLYGENIDQRTFVSGNYAGDLISEHIQFDNQINYNINSFRNYIGIGFVYNWNRLEPKIDPEIGDNIYNLSHYDFRNIDINVHYIHNTLNKIFYAEKGSYMQVKLGTSVYTHMVAKLAPEFNYPDIIGSVSPFTKFRFNTEKRIPLSKKLSAIVGIDGGFTFYNDTNQDRTYKNFGYAANYFLGGNINRPRNDTFVLPGLEEMELATTQFSMLKLATQYNPTSSIYFTPHLNFAIVGFDDFNNYFDSFFSAQNKWVEETETSYLTSIGLTTSYNSILGPIDFDISWVNNLSGARLFFGIGYHFTQSN
ncbi:patatin-like phospholipase family protein [Flavicella marina]|uniref:patatin-like phospholipase family protein n=1 Tax=Flavicella marina TaxID=1475951 RepID=UPI0012650D43|nr:patatin-like phospholipase family protein [Flavicella marina]